ncbi:hypothetical protein, partial [Aeromonas salmonicida]|uniref:hypothetical protein n=1 Tax=Aeromonas salmonicida TaxID=645 RepID=UPI001C5F0460
KEMVVIRSPSPQLVPFKLHRFGQQRPTNTVSKTEDMTPKKKPAECIITESGKAFLHAMAAPVSPMMIEKSVTGI